MEFRHLSHKKGLTAVDRFWAQLEKGRGCWNWIGSKDGDGYGQIVVNKSSMKSHRFSWLIHNGEIPHKMLVCHHCDNPGCVNPKHLFIGTNKDNMVDAANKGRTLQGAKNHFCKLTVEIVLEIRRRHLRNHKINGTGPLAKEFGVSESCIYKIVSRQIWKHVERENNA